MDLKVKKEELRKTKIKLSVEVPIKVFDEFRKVALEKLAKELDIKGFRKGKVPVKVAQKHLEGGRIDQEALQMALPEVYGKVVVDEGLKPVGQPKVNIKQFEENKPVKIEYTFDILPEVKLADYNNLKVKKEQAKLSKKDIKEGLESLRKRLADYEDKKGKAEKGDWVEVDFEGKLKGVKVDQLSSKHHPFVIGQGGFVKGFEENIIGMKKDDKKTFKLKLPKNHSSKDFAGKEVEFEVKINSVRKVKLPSLKEVSKKMGASDEKDLEKKFTEAQKQQIKVELEKKYEQDLIAQLVGKSQFEVPEALADQEYQRISHEQEHQFTSQGVTKEQYLKQLKLDEDKYEKRLKDSAQENVKVALVMNALASKENIKPTKAEIKKRTEEMISQGMMQGGDKNDLRDQYESDQGQNFINNVLRNQKTLERLKELNSKEKNRPKKKK